MLIHSTQQAHLRYAEISPASISKYIDGFRQLAVKALLSVSKWQERT
jgi:hypothetical protein